MLKWSIKGKTFTSENEYECGKCHKPIHKNEPFVWMYREYMTDGRIKAKHFRVHVECVYENK